MAQKTLVIDLDRCIGCYACEAACKLENNVPMGVYYNKVLTIGPVGKYPDIHQYFLLESMSDRSYLQDGRRTDSGEQREVHRLQDVYRSMSVRCSFI